MQFGTGLKGDSWFQGKAVVDPLPEEVRKKVMQRANFKCEEEGCLYNIYLVFHRKNMRKNDNSLNNVLLLCPIHHEKLCRKFLENRKEEEERVCAERVVEKTRKFWKR